MSLWAIVPARGGSKGLPGKNLRLLAGKPLVAHAVDAAWRTPGVSRVIVSTDDPSIAAAAREAGAEVPFLRPDRLSHDRAELRDAVYYTLDRLTEQGDAPPDRFLVLYPTHPFRTSAALRRGVELLERYAHVSSAVPMEVRLARIRALAPDGAIPLGDSDEPLRLHLLTGSFVGSHYAPPGSRSHEDSVAWRGYLHENRPADFSSGSALVVSDDPGAHIDINTEADLRRAEAHARGEAISESPAIWSLPYCVVALHRLSPTHRSTGERAELPVTLDPDADWVVVWRARRPDSRAFGPLWFHRIRRVEGQTRVSPLFGAPANLRARAELGRLSLEVELPRGAAGAWIGLGRAGRGDEPLDLVKPFSLLPVWSYDPDTATRTNLLTGRIIRGRQDLPTLVSEVDLARERVA